MGSTALALQLALWICIMPAQQKRKDVREPMLRVARTLASVLAAVITTACDPVVGVLLTVAPPEPPVSDSAHFIDAPGIAATLASRNGLTQPGPLPDGYLAYFTTRVRNTGRGYGFQELALWLHRRRNGQLDYHVGEAITLSWSPEGARVRRELEDTLRLRYGDLFSVDTVPELTATYPGAELVALAVLPFAPPVAFLGLEAHPENFTALPNYFSVRLGGGIWS